MTGLDRDSSPSPPASRLSRPRKILLGLSLALLAGSVLLLTGPESPAPDPTAVGGSGARPGMPMPTDPRAQAELDAMVVAEELIWGLTETIGELAFAVGNLELPDARTRKIFWPLGLRISDLAPAPEAVADAALTATLEPLRITPQAWPVGEVQELTAPELDLWRPLLDRVSYFAHTKFKIKTGHFVDDPNGGPRQFETKVKFAGLARMRSGELSWIRTTQILRWRSLRGKDPEEAGSWRILSWDLIDAQRLDAAEPLFEEVLGEAIPDPGQRERARHSIHERLVADRILAKRASREHELPHEEFTDMANDRHPGLAIVDLDRDGWDDLYVMARWGRNQLFHNQGDGTFVEKAAEFGLDIDGWSSSAIFADFDNDGDADLFLGRTLQRTAYFENRDGRFVEIGEQNVEGELPYFASSISAADYDGDGLLDVYVSTYASMRTQPEHYQGYLPPHQIETFRKMREAGVVIFVDNAGPPNVLLHNEGGGRFSIVSEPGPLAAWRHTYQATWSDYDRDGDPDVYLSNDFSPDELIRNDGEGRFVRVTDEHGIIHVGLGMGASWGDYDRDGLQDVYVSNMYSTAGTRITDRLSYLDPRLVETAQGNYLYRNQGEGFLKTSGRKPPELPVQEAGWSWGGQFGDVDNDGFLDLVVPNGFYTAPPEVALSGDT